MKDRPDAKIYREAEKILRLRHFDEFETIRKELLEKSNIVLQPRNTGVAAKVQRNSDLTRMYRLICKYYRNNGYCPSIAILEFRLKLGSRESARKLLAELIDEGKLKRQEIRTTLPGVGNYVITDKSVRFSEE